MIDVLLVEQWATGGTARYASYLASALGGGSMGVNITLAVPAEYPYTPEHCTLVRIGDHTCAPMRSRVEKVYRLLIHGFRIEQELLKLLRRRRPDVLHVLGTWLVSPRLLRTARALEIPILVTVHDVPATSGYRTRLINRQLRPRFMEADHVFVHGNWTAAQLTGDGRGQKSSVSVIPFGPYSYGPPTGAPAQLRERFDLPRDRTVVLFFGSLRKNKGLATLLEAIAMTAKEEFHLFVVASRPAQSEPPASHYQTRADQLGITERVTWLIEYVDDAMVPDVFGAADILALPYDRSFAAQSAVMAIALAYAVPVVCSDVGDLGPLVSNGGLGAVAEPESPASFVKALRSIGETGRFSDAIRGVESRSSWEAVALATGLTYKDVLSSTAQRRGLGK